MSNRMALIAVLVLAVVATQASSPPASAQEVAVWLNTTLDLPYEAAHCQPGQICTFRAAIEKAVSFGAAVRACFEEPCPLGATQLSKEDPGYDPATDRWIITFNESFQPLVLDGKGLDVDFTATIDGWSSPADNRIVLVNPITYNHMFMVEATEIKLAGFEIQGSFIDAAIVVRNQASRNQFGPGLNFVGFPEGNGIRLLDAGTSENRIVGNWCGLTVDSSGEVVPDGLLVDCVHIARGASDNIVGGPEPEDRNVFSASKLGFGIALHDPATRNNTIEGNYIGTDPTGTKPMGNESGIAIFDEAIGTHIHDNVISGNKNHGLFLSNASTELGRNTTLIEDNFIGTDYSGLKPLGNQGYGISIQGLSKRTHVAHNRIWFNAVGGVIICGKNTRYNTITENSISYNSGIAIDVCEGANGGVQVPVIDSCSAHEVLGVACPGCKIEVFSDPGEEAEIFEGSATAGADGTFTFRKPSGFTYDNLTITATEDKNTSGLSSPCYPSVYPTLTPTVSPGDTPVPTSTPDIRPVVWLYLPWAGNAADIRAE